MTATNNEGETKSGSTVCEMGQRFTVADLFYKESLEELVSQGVKFQLVAYHLENLSAFDLLPEDRQDELFWLQEEIFEAVNATDAVVGWKPRKLDIVLARKGASMSYHRCILTDFVNDKRSYASVFWIDEGGTGTVPVVELKPVNNVVMSHPRLAYSVILADCVPSSNFILHDDFKRAMDEIVKKEMITVELCGPVKETQVQIFCKTPVKLTFMESGNKTVNLRDVIMELKKWEWETFSNLTGDDNEVLRCGIWGLKFRAEFQDDFPIPYILPPETRQFSATVSRVSTDDQNPKNAVIKIILLSSSTYFNYFNVLHNQMERYATNIKKSKFFPAIKDALLFKLDDKPEYKGNMKSLGTWHRALRIDKERLYLIDLDDYVPYDHVPENDYESRPLYYEFFRVPCLTVTVRPTCMGFPLTLAEARNIFKNGHRYEFSVTKRRDGSDDQELCEVSYAPVENQPNSKLTVNEFMSFNAFEKN